MKFKPGDIVRDNDVIYQIVSIIRNNPDDPSGNLLQLKLLSYIGHAFDKLRDGKFSDHTKPIEKKAWELKLFSGKLPKFYFNDYIGYFKKQIGLNVSGYVKVVFYENNNYHYWISETMDGSTWWYGFDVDESYFRRI